MGKVIQIEVPEGMEKEFVETLKELIDTAKTMLLMKIINKSELSEEDAERISEEIKLDMAKKHEVSG